jgi:hypothetical protein
VTAQQVTSVVGERDRDETSIDEVGGKPGSLLEIDISVPFDFHNLRVHPKVLPCPDELPSLVSECCTGIELRLRSGRAKEVLGVVTISSNGDPSSISGVLQELVMPSGRPHEIVHKETGVVHHDFLRRLLHLAERTGCRVDSDLGQGPAKIAKGYSDRLQLEAQKIQTPRTVTAYHYDKGSHDFVPVKGKGYEKGAPLLIDVDLPLPDGLSQVDNFRRAVRSSPKELNQLAGILKMSEQEVQEELRRAHILQLRLFRVNTEAFPAVSREKVFFASVGKAAILFHDGPSTLARYGPHESYVRALCERVLSPAALFLGLSEFCFEAGQGVVDELDSTIVQRIAQKSHDGGRLSQGTLLALQRAEASLSHIKRKFEEHKESLSVWRRLNGGANSEVAADLENHAQEVQDFIMRAQGAVSDVERIRSTHDSIIKGRTDTNVLRLTLAAGALAPATFGAASAIIEFLPEWAKVGFFIAGNSAAVVMLAAAGISTLRERRRTREQTLD